MQNNSGKKLEREWEESGSEEAGELQYIITDEDLVELAQRLNLQELEEVLQVVRVDEGAFKKQIGEEKEALDTVKREREKKLVNAAKESVYLNLDDLYDTPEAPEVVSEMARKELSTVLKERSRIDDEFIKSFIEDLESSKVTDIRDVRRKQESFWSIAFDEGVETPDVSSPVYEGYFDLKTILLYKHLPKETYCLAAICVDLPALIGAVERFRLARGDIDPRLIVGLCEKLYQGVASRMLYKMVLGRPFFGDPLDDFVRNQLEILELCTKGPKKCMDRVDIYRHLGLLLKHIDKKTSAQIAGTDDLYLEFIESEEFQDASI